MPAPKGNKNSVGKGRKSYAQEKADYQMLEKMFLAEMAKEDVQKKLASGKYSLKDVFVSKAFAGNEKILSEIFRKLFPDNVMMRVDGRISTSKLQDEELTRLMEVFKDEK